MARCLRLVMAAKKRASSSGPRTTGRVRGCLTGREADGGVVAAQSLAIEKSQGAAGRIIVAVRDVLLLKEVEQVGADLFGSEAIRRAMEVAGEAGDRSNVDFDGRWGEVAQGHVVDHAATQGCHVPLLCG